MKTFIFIAIFIAILSGLSAQSTISIDYNQSTNIFSATLNPPIAAAGAKRKPYWTFFWEFGDGNYSTSSAPKYCYAQKGDYKVKVSVVAHYSHQPTKTYEQTITVKSVCNNPPLPALSNNVKITTNASNELVPNNDIRIALTYRNTNAANSKGYLLLCYNHPSEKAKIKFNPFTYTENKLYKLYDAKPLSNAKDITQYTRLDEKAKTYLNSLLSQQYALLAFECDFTNKNQNNAFVTLSANPGLDTVVLKRIRGEATANLRAVWLPQNATFEADKMVANYPLTLLSVHDPNKMKLIEPNGNARYHKKYPETFEFTVKFQNEGNGAVKSLDLVTDWDQTLDLKTLKVLKRDPSLEECPICQPNFDTTQTRASCFSIDTSRVDSEGKVYFTYKNVMIHGKDEEGIGGGKYTKGFVTYTAKSNGEKREQVKAQTTVKFEGGEPFKTNKVSRTWHHTGIGVKLGANLMPNLNNYEPLSESPLQYYNIGLYKRNTPLLSGLSLYAGWEASLSGLAFESINTEDDQIFTPAGFPLTQLIKETINLNTLDLQVQSEFRLKEIVAVGAGGGISIPVFASGDFKGVILEIFDSSIDPVAQFEELYNAQGAIFRDDPSAEFGWLQNPTETLIFNQDITSKRNVGYLFHWFLEAGLLNDAALGIRQNFRFYPNSYKQQCLTITNFEAYVRFKLASSKKGLR